MISILNSFYSFVMGIYSAVSWAWNTVTTLIRFIGRMYAAVQVYFTEIPVWILPFVTFSFSMAVMMFILHRR